MTNTITVSRELLEQALSYVGNSHPTLREALRAALAQPTEQDKVAIMQRIADSNTGFVRKQQEKPNEGFYCPSKKRMCTTCTYVCLSSSEPKQ